jgi:tRNA A37 threonylcarbamoyladenosine dehydratase
VSAADEHPITPKADRERVLNVFCQKHDCTKTKVADEAEVDPADLYKWVRDELPKRSKKSARIEAVLRRGIVKRTG